MYANNLTFEERHALRDKEEKEAKDASRKEQMKQQLAQVMRLGAVAMAGVMALSAVGTMFRSEVLTEGNFGIEKHWGGSYNEQTLSSGLKLNLFDKIYEVYGRESLIKIEDVRPKDKGGTMLKDLDLNIAVKANKENAVPFLLKTGDIEYNRDKDAFILGKNIIPKEARSVATQTIRKFESEELIDKQSIVEETFKVDLQAQLDTLYGKNTFTVTDVKMANVQFADAVEEKIQSIEMIKAEESKAHATDKILKIRNEMLNKEVNGLQEVAKNNGISFDQLLDYQKTKALMEQKVNPTLTMPASSAKAPKMGH